MCKRWNESGVEIERYGENVGKLTSLFINFVKS